MYHIYTGSEHPNPYTSLGLFIATACFGNVEMRNVISRQLQAISKTRLVSQLTSTFSVATTGHTTSTDAGAPVLPSAGTAVSALNNVSAPARKKSQVYTRTGDKGTSSLYSGERRKKSDAAFEALGNQDELNAVLGVTAEYCILANNGLDAMIAEIQSQLFDLGAAIATPIQTSSDSKKKYTEFPHSFTDQLEAWIDGLDSLLPPVTNFIIPRGGFSSTYLNLARTVCRRAERSVISMVAADQVDREVAVYLNRLSDLLFVASRIAAAREDSARKTHTELLWTKGGIKSLNTLIGDEPTGLLDASATAVKIQPELLASTVSAPVLNNTYTTKPVTNSKNSSLSPEIEASHRAACEKEESFYVDPTSGLFVMTEYSLRQRGTCCGNGCRHCPYGHINVRKKGGKMS